MNAVNNLPQMIREAIEQRDLTYRAIAQRAQAAGYSLSHSTVSVYATGKSRQYSREKLEAIAVGLGINKDTFTSSAHMPTLGAPFELPAESAMLDPHERDAVRRVVEAFIETKTRRELVSHSDDTSMYPAAGSAATDDEDPVDELAARRKEPHRRRRPGHDPEWDALYSDQRAASEGDPALSKDQISDDST